MALNRCYFISATHRCGSTYLCELLRSTNRAGVPREYFHPNCVNGWCESHHLTSFVDYLALIKKEGATKGVFGSKVMFSMLVNGLIPELKELDAANNSPLELLNRAFPGLQFISITRNDKIQQAWSWLKARQTGQWISGQDQRQGTPIFDEQEVLALSRQIAEEDILWERFFDVCGIRPLRVVYEELVQEPLIHLNRCLVFLGLSPEDDLRQDRIRTARQSNDKDRELVASLREQVMQR